MVGVREHVEGGEEMLLELSSERRSQCGADIRRLSHVALRLISMNEGGFPEDSVMLSVARVGSTDEVPGLQQINMADGRHSFCLF